MILAIFSFLSVFCFAHSDAPGQVLDIVTIEHGNFVPHYENLKTILDQLAPQTEIAVIAIGGEYRKGKSFLLNFFLQYLQYRSFHDKPARVTDADLLDVQIRSKTHAWLRDVLPNSGFQYKAGLDAQTTGINVWSIPYVIERMNGKKLAILVMDSQGLYDSTTSSNDNVRLFTMVSLLSSSLLLNTPQNINLLQLSQLGYFMDYATTSSFSNRGKPFQRLTFLIRDFIDETFGWDGGMAALDMFMMPSHDTGAEVRAVAHNLTKGFDVIDSFALPYPGRRVTRKDYNGDLSGIDEEFLQHLEAFVINITEDARPRTPLVISITAADMADYVTKIAETFNAKLPPDELMKIKERELFATTHQKIDGALKNYTEGLDAYYIKTSDEFYTDRELFDIIKDVMKYCISFARYTVASFWESPFGNITIELKSDGSGVTAVELLRDKIKRWDAENEKPIAHYLEVRHEDVQDNIRGFRVNDSGRKYRCGNESFCLGSCHEFGVSLRKGYCYLTSRSGLIWEGPLVTCKKHSDCTSYSANYCRYPCFWSTPTE